MGCDYGSIGLLGIAVPIEKFVTSTTEEVRNCSHELPADTSANFCPKCGRKLYIRQEKRVISFGLDEDKFVYGDTRLLGKWPVFLDQYVHKNLAWICISRTKIVYIPGSPVTLNETSFDDGVVRNTLISSFITDMKSLDLWDDDQKIEYWIIPYISC